MASPNPEADVEGNSRKSSFNLAELTRRRAPFVSNTKLLRHFQKDDADEMLTFPAVFRHTPIKK